MNKFFENISDGFIYQCVDNDPNYVRSLLKYMSTESFENELIVDKYTKTLKQYARYLNCKLCDGNDNHRTFYFDPVHQTLKLNADESLLLHLTKIKLYEIQIAIF